MILFPGTRKLMKLTYPGAKKLSDNLYYQYLGTALKKYKILPPI